MVFQVQRINKTTIHSPDFYDGSGIIFQMSRPVSELGGFSIYQGGQSPR